MFGFIISAIILLIILEIAFKTLKLVVKIAFLLLILGFIYYLFHFVSPFMFYF